MLPPPELCLLSRCNHRPDIRRAGMRSHRTEGRTGLHYTAHCSWRYTEHRCTWRGWQCQGIVLVLNLCPGANRDRSCCLYCLNIGTSLFGQGVGGEYPASSTSASEAANEQAISKRGPSMLLSLIPFRVLTNHSCRVLT